MLKDFLSRHRVPVGVTTIGLTIALFLGLAPSIKPDGPDITPQAVSEAATARIEELSAQGEQREAVLNTQISKLETQVDILNRAMTRTNIRVQTQRARSAEMDAANIVARITDLETRAKTFNLAITRMNLRIRDIRTEMSTLTAAASLANKHDPQVETLNAAVTRLNKKLGSLSDIVATLQ